MPSKRLTPAVSFSFTVRVSYPNRVGFLANITRHISRVGGDLGAVDVIASDRKRMTRDFTIQGRDEAHVEETEALMGADPFVYGLEPNRKQLETFLEYELEQGMIHEPIAVNDLFAIETR